VAFFPEPPCWSPSSCRILTWCGLTTPSSISRVTSMCGWQEDGHFLDRWRFKDNKLWTACREQLKILARNLHLPHVHPAHIRHQKAHRKVEQRLESQGKQAELPGSTGDLHALCAYACLRRALDSSNSVPSLLCRSRRQGRAC